jgi:sugar O-acyltransferase (sialic acid O-acetyltransferase NeuD family)
MRNIKIKKKIDIVIFGSGDHAKVIFSEIINYNKYNIIGFVDEIKKNKDLIIKHKNKKYYTLGKISENIKKNNLRGIIGVGSNFVRKKIYKKIISINKKFKFEKIISKNSIINKNVFIKEGTFIGPGVVINQGTNIGKHCIINTSSSIDHDNIFEDFSSTAPGVITGGNVVVRENSNIGIGSIIKHQVEIKKNTVIGGNSFVTKNCDSNFLYFGSPSKKIRKISNSEEYLK